MSRTILPFLCAAVLAAAVPAFAADAIPVTITVDAAKPTGPLNPIWRWCGYDEPNYTYAPNGKKLVEDFTGGKDSPFGEASFRAHSLLVTGDGTPHLKWGSTNAYTEDAAGKPVYDWTIIDKIFDTYHDAGAKPYAQIGFMPKALSLKPDPYEHHWTPGGNASIFTGWDTPPNDYNKWRELCYQWAKHSLERYGQKEVDTWHWEVWNEPNIGYLVASAPGGNKVVDYEKMWDFAADGIRKALPNAIVGGPETAGDGGTFQRDFIEHCINGTNYATGEKGSPLGLISFHAKGAPTSFRTHNYVQMGLANQLATVETAFRAVASRPQTAKLPVVIGESDPDGCAACKSADGLYPELGYRNTSLFASYTIEQLTRTMDLAERHNTNLLGAVTWAFEFEDQPIFGGFRALATDGVGLPVLNTFRMLNKMGTKRLSVTSTGDVGVDSIIGRTPAANGNGTVLRGVRGDKPDVMALASRDDKRITVIAWNYYDDDVAGPAADITINITGLPADLATAKLSEWGVDETHSNSFTAWKKMDSPAKPTVEQHKALEDASQLAQLQPPSNVDAKQGAASVKVTIPRQGVTLIELAW